jgi:hypothetical protein
MQHRVAQRWRCGEKIRDGECVPIRHEIDAVVIEGGGMVGGGDGVQRGGGASGGRHWKVKREIAI